MLSATMMVREAKLCLKAWRRTEGASAVSLTVEVSALFADESFERLISQRASIEARANRPEGDNGRVS